MKCLLLAAMVMLFAPCAFAQGDEKDRIEAVARVKSFSDEQLRQALDKLLDGPDFRQDSVYEPCLNEIVGRGGKTWEAYLNVKLQTLNKRRIHRFNAEDTEPGSNYNLELLTALRRIQKKPDPLVVVLEAKGPLEATPLSLPRLKVAFKNVDCEKAAAGFTDGGEYRSGRQARWRVVAQRPGCGVAGHGTT